MQDFMCLLLPKSKIGSRLWNLNISVNVFLCGLSVFKIHSRHLFLTLMSIEDDLTFS